MGGADAGGTEDADDRGEVTKEVETVDELARNANEANGIEVNLPEDGEWGHK